jgi:hypothetical protein
LRENGTNIMKWTEGMWQDLADELRVISEARPDLQFEGLIETLDKRDKSDGTPTRPSNRSDSRPESRST